MTTMNDDCSLKEHVVDRTNPLSEQLLFCSNIQTAHEEIVITKELLQYWALCAVNLENPTTDRIARWKSY